MAFGCLLDIETYCCVSLCIACMLFCGCEMILIGCLVEHRGMLMCHTTVHKQSECACFQETAVRFERFASLRNARIIMIATAINPLFTFKLCFASLSSASAGKNSFEVNSEDETESPLVLIQARTRSSFACDTQKQQESETRRNMDLHTLVLHNKTYRTLKLAPILQQSRTGCCVCRLN